MLFPMYTVFVDVLLKMTCIELHEHLKVKRLGGVFIACEVLKMSNSEGQQLRNS